MQSGTNILPIYVANVSGNGVIGLTTSDFSVKGYVGSTVLDTATIAASPSANGYYLATVSIPVGQGFISITPTNTNYSVSPSFYDIDATLYDVDDVYSSIARQTLDITQVSVTSYEAQNIGPFKEADDVVIDYVIPDSVTSSISGYSNFKASLYSADVLTSISGAGKIADFALTVSPTTKSVKMVMPGISGARVSEGKSEEYFYSDLQCTTNEGYNKTLAEFNILFKRQYTR